MMPVPHDTAVTSSRGNGGTFPSQRAKSRPKGCAATARRGAYKARNAANCHSCIDDSPMISEGLSALGNFRSPA